MFNLPPAQWQRLRACLDEAMALPPQARAAWLQGLSGDDEVLRPRLEALLHEAAAQEAATRPGPIESGPMLACTTGPELGIPGAWVGPYRLRTLLGRGGMGEVWLAERTDMLLGRQVALKLPNRDQWQRGLGDRLAREREILATLEHPNIARLHEAGVGADGQPYIALEFVDGERIDEHVERQGLGTAQRIGLFLQVCDAVAHAHARLVVHRDLKPANILVDRQGRVKLLDFGIARLLEQAPASAGDLTTAHGSPMTPRYAAPEQRRGEVVGTAVDIYVLGLVLLELLIGRQAREAASLPGDADSAEDSAGEMPRASQLAGSATLRDALRGDLDTIIGKALRQEPAARYPSVEAMAADLRRHLAHEPVLARPASPGYRLQRFVRRHRLGVTATAAFVASLLAVTALALGQAQEAQQQRDQALQARADADAAAERARQAQRLAEAQSNYSDFLLSDAAKDQSNEAAAAQLERSLSMVRSQYRDDPALRGELLGDVAMRLRWIGRDQRAAELFAEAEPLLRDNGRFDGVARILCVRAREAAQRSHFDEGRRLLDEARAALARSNDPKSLVHAGCLLEEAALVRLAGAPQQAVGLTQLAWEHEHRAGRGDRPFAAEVLMSLSRAHLEAAQPAAAASAARRSLHALTLAGHDLGPALWQGRVLLGMALREGGQNRAALDAFHGEGQADSTDTRRSPSARMQYAVTLSAQGRHREALAVLGGVRAEVLSSGSASQRRALAVRLASAQLAAGQVSTAGQTLMAAERDFAGLRTKRQAAARPYLLALADWRLRQNQLAQAETLMQELREHFAAPQPSAEPARAWHRLATRLALQQGRPDAALGAAQQALVVSQGLAIDRQASLQVGEDLLLRARVHEARHDALAAGADALAAMAHIEGTAGAEHGALAEARALRARVGDGGR